MPTLGNVALVEVRDVFIPIPIWLEVAFPFHPNLTIIVLKADALSGLHPDRTFLGFADFADLVQSLVQTLADNRSCKRSCSCLTTNTTSWQLRILAEATQS